MHTLDRPISAINDIVESEGWAIFNDGQIQRDDEMDVFTDDAEAIAHVRRCAAAGSAIHVAALKLCGLSA